ncbi:hypothetical protein TUM19329_30300 [Legionella antarctica]|uniref:Uncharacterized protein n=1 Tax=Legionella antarctica TaxID=2708020 RepID=A0A6F8T877_9GAMM|nr:hypothetical protein TUM19329_30300 [Legionella antarctica]
MLTIDNISLGAAFVAGKNRVPKPATGNTALSIGAYLDFMGNQALYIMRIKVLLLFINTIESVEKKH